MHIKFQEEIMYFIGNDRDEDDESMLFELYYYFIKCLRKIL